MSEPDELSRLRDHFAAAALTGLLSNVQRYQNEPLTRQAFEIADFMLRERGNHIAAAGKMVEKPTNHDAAPAARATEPESSVPLGSGVAPAAQEPVAWAVMDGHEFMEFCTDKEDAKCASGFYGDCPIVPLYRQPTLTDAEREAVEQAAIRVEALCQQGAQRRAATLRGLLERTQTGGK